MSCDRACGSERPALNRHSGSILPRSALSTGAAALSSVRRRSSTGWSGLLRSNLVSGSVLAGSPAAFGKLVSDYTEKLAQSDQVGGHQARVRPAPAGAADQNLRCILEVWFRHQAAALAGTEISSADEPVFSARSRRLRARLLETPIRGNALLRPPGTALASALDLNRTPAR